MVEKAGGKMQLFYTLGDYDFVMLVELPTDEAAVTVLARLGSMGETCVRRRLRRGRRWKGQKSSLQHTLRVRRLWLRFSLYPVVQRWLFQSSNRRVPPDL